MGHTYVSKIPDHTGMIAWSDTERQTWRTLIMRQTDTIRERASREFMIWLDQIAFDTEYIPQHPCISDIVYDATGWEVVRVPALISDVEFYGLLSQKRFPATSFIRIPEELDYLEEPDIFHEFFGHLPLITWRQYADFLERFALFFLGVDPQYHQFLIRIFWFTIEFGLIETTEWIRIYGAGILSSHGETLRVLEDPNIIRLPFDILTCIRTPYRYDIMQSKYFFIRDFDELFSIFDTDLTALFEEAILLWDIS